LSSRPNAVACRANGISNVATFDKDSPEPAQKYLWNSTGSHMNICDSLMAHPTLAQLFLAIKRTDLEILAPILGQIRILRPITYLIFAYETRVLKAVEGRFD